MELTAHANNRRLRPSSNNQTVQCSAEFVQSERSERRFCRTCRFHQWFLCASRSAGALWKQQIDQRNPRVNQLNRRHLSCCWCCGCRRRRRRGQSYDSRQQTTLNSSYPIRNLTSLAFVAIIILGIATQPIANLSLSTLDEPGKPTAPNDLDHDGRSLRPDWSSTVAGQSAAQNGVKLGAAVNKSLDLLATTPMDSSNPQLNGIRRLLVRQLTSLIRNNEPESIAQEMEGARIRGQLVSESSSGIEGFDEGQSVSSGADNNQHSLALVATSDADSPPDSGSQSRDGSEGQEKQQQHQQTTPQQTTEVEQYVTCAPDYEDQSLLEINQGNLTAEQQQQLLAGVDSSGMLNPEGLQDAEGPRSGVHPSPCVQPGNRMIEVITKVITPILFSIIIVVGLVGNIIVMMVILEDRKTEREYTPTGLLILDLSLADLSFIVFCIPFTGWDYSVGHWVFGSLWCKFNQYLIVVCALSSIYTLVLMSVDRFMAIVYPIECIAYRTSKNTLYAIYIKWIVILIIASPSIQMHGLIDGALPDQYVCRFLSTSYNPLHFQIVFFVTSYLFPLILIFCLYLSLLNKLWFGSRPHGHKESIKTLESKKKVTWLVAGIVIVFALCWCPIQVMLILMRLKSHRITATYVAIQVFSHTLGYMNSCVNPIVYAFASETFNNSFKRSSLGRFCYSCLCIGNPSNDHDHRSSNFRTIHHNNHGSIANNEMGSHYRHSQQMNNNDMLPLSNTNITNNINNSTNNNNNCGTSRNGQDSNSSATTILNGTNADDCRPSKVVRSPSVKTATTQDNRIGSSLADVHHLKETKSSDQNGLTTGYPASGATPAKQQLVARMINSGGNQIAHKCEPCYQQQESIGRADG